MTSPTNNSEQLVSCSFCGEKFSSLEIGSHLMTCGNKTDQCPNCRKYIRRAIFAYHYENNCANLDELDADVGTAAQRPDASSTFQPNNPAPFSSGPAAENNKNRTIEKVDLATPPEAQNTTPQRSNSRSLITFVCPHCAYEFDPADHEIHQENCLRNPKNIAKKQQLQNNPNFGQNSNRLNHVDNPNDTADIPCEYCNQPIKWSNYHNHMQACATQHPLRIQEQPQQTYRIDEPTGNRCRYCNKQYFRMYLEMHQRNCQQNPHNIASEEHYKTIYCYYPGQTMNITYR